MGPYLSESGGGTPIRGLRWVDFLKQFPGEDTPEEVIDDYLESLFEAFFQVPVTDPTNIVLPKQASGSHKEHPQV